MYNFVGTSATGFNVKQRRFKKNSRASPLSSFIMHVQRSSLYCASSIVKAVFPFATCLNLDRRPPPPMPAASLLCTPPAQWTHATTRLPGCMQITHSKILCQPNTHAHTLLRQAAGGCARASEYGRTHCNGRLRINHVQHQSRCAPTAVVRHDPAPAVPRTPPHGNECRPPYCLCQQGPPAQLAKLQGCHQQRHI